VQATPPAAMRAPAAGNGRPARRDGWSRAAAAAEAPAPSNNRRKRPELYHAGANVPPVRDPARPDARAAARPPEPEIEEPAPPPPSFPPRPQVPVSPSPILE
jgi:hypothetical protein